MVKPRRSADPHALAGVYALGTLTESERKEFERHLARCAECAREVRGLSEIAAELGMAATATPPERIRAGVFLALPHVPQVRTDPGVDPAVGPGTIDLAARRRDRNAAPASRVRQWLAAGAAAAAVAAIVALGVSLANARHDLSVARTEQQALSQLLNSPGVRIVTAPASGGGTVTTIVSPVRGKLICLTKGLPALPSSRVYQVWLIGPAGIRSAGLLAQHAGGALAPLVAAGVRGGDRVGITVEPAGGTAQPTTKPIVLTPRVA